MDSRNSVGGNQNSFSPPLEGEGFSLCAMTGSFYEEAYEIFLSNFIEFRWRFPGALPSQETFERTLHNQVLAQFVVVNSETRAMAGWVMLHNPSLKDGTAYLTQILSKNSQVSETGVLTTTLRYAFSTWSLRKIYISCTSGLSVVGSADIPPSLLKEEGRLRSHRFYNGRYWDDVTYAIYREDATSLLSSPSVLTPDGVTGDARTP
jgi:hypothetical protein